MPTVFQQIRPQKKFLPSNNNQNTQNKEKIFKAVKEKGQVTYKTYQNYSRLLVRDYESQKILEKCHTEPKRTQMPARTTINSQLPQMEKPRYSMTKPNLYDILPQIQPFKG